MSAEGSKRVYKPGDPIKVYFELGESDATGVQIGFELHENPGEAAGASSVGFDIGDLLPIAKAVEKQTVMSEGRVPDGTVKGTYALSLHFESGELNSRHIQCDYLIEVESDEDSARLPSLNDIARISVE